MRENDAVDDHTYYRKFPMNFAKTSQSISLKLREMTAFAKACPNDSFGIVS